MDATLLSARADPVADHLARFAAAHGAPAAPPEAMWQALRAAGLEAPGLAFAEWAELTVLGGLVGSIAVNSPDIGSLLDDLERFHPLFGRERIVLTRRPRAVTLTLRAPDGLPANPDTVEACFALLCRVIRSMTGDEAGPSRVALRRARPEDTGDYETAFVRQVAFGQPADACVFTSESLRAPVPGADTVVRSMLHAYAERRLAHQNVPWAKTVTDLLREESQAGSQGSQGSQRSQASQGSQTSLTTIARALSVSPRTLQDRLTREGTSFAALTDDLRRERALALLSQPGLAITTIATRLGFATPSALTRAFRRWTGMSPSAYRREAGIFDEMTD